MKIGSQVSVTCTAGEYAGRTLLLDVEEFQSTEPSMYVWTPGYYCAVEIAGELEWFFIEVSGEVYHDNEQVGICPEQEAEWALWEQEA